METISAVLSVFNEEAKLMRTLEALKWVDEIIVIDNESTDQTASIAKKYGATVYKEKNNLMLNINKNKGFMKAKCDWILYFDGDEVVTPELAQEIQHITHHASRITHHPEIVGYWIPRKNILFGKWIQHGLWWPDKQLRLFKRGMGIFPCKHVHEYLVVDGPTSELTTPMVHYNYESVSQFIRKMDEIYSVSEVNSLLSSGYALVWYDAIKFPMSDFVKTYFAQGGYKDGLHGLVLSMLQAFYSFIVFAKLWEFEKFREHELPVEVVEKEMVRAREEVRYWLLSAKLGDTQNAIKKIWYRILRKHVRTH